MISGRIRCLIDGHQWGKWDSRVWEDLLGGEWRVRWCRRCGARGRGAA